MSKLDDFIIHSQYPVEKIVWTAEGDIDSSNPNWHETDWGGRVFEPLQETLNWQNISVDGVWTDDDWVSQYQLEGENKPFVYSGNVEFGWVSASAFPKGIDFFGYVLPTDCVVLQGISSETFGIPIKYRLWAYLNDNDFASSTTDKTVEDISYKLQKDTRLAQLSLVSENIIQVPNDTTKTYYHNLGFRPFCKMWHRFVQNGIEGDWSRELWTLDSIETTDHSPSSLLYNTISIDEEKITITAHDGNIPEYQSERQDFLIRIYNYALPI